MIFKEKRKKKKKTDIKFYLIINELSTKCFVFNQENINYEYMLSLNILNPLLRMKYNLNLFIRIEMANFNLLEEY